VLNCEQSFPATVVWLLALCAGFTMSGLATDDYSGTLNPVSANEVSSSLDNHPTKALPILYDLVHLCRADPSLPVVAPSIASLTALGSIKKDSLPILKLTSSMR
jgi:hypothetical protein